MVVVVVGSSGSGGGRDNGGGGDRDASYLVRCIHQAFSPSEAQTGNGVQTSSLHLSPSWP